ncbi:MAG TPA: ParB/RepB/Spo0J family partition protein [Anaerolineae bacterium]|nr:ParB/RepB/Spo0J family partition protein [Anaerolineae bacterium]
MSRKSGLGKGLDALIPTSEGTTLGMDVLQVSVDLIKPNPRQPRSTIQPESLKELADSIIEHGVIQPLVVSRDENKQEYILVAGDRRLQAARLAGLRTVPVLVRQTTDQERLEMALVENLQRIDLNPLESAQGYQMLSEDFGLSHEEIAKRVGKNRTTVTNTLRLLKLSQAVRNALTEGLISEGHARAILPLPSAKSQSAALQAILNSELNVRQTEALVRRLSGEHRKETKPRKRSAEEIALEDQLRESLGTRVTLRRGSKGGSLIIHFYSDEELNALVDKLLGETAET